MEGIIRDKTAKLVYDSHADDEEEKDDTADCGLYLEGLNIGPKKKLVVLGLGGFLCYREFRFVESSVAKFRGPDGEYGNYLVYKRPYREEFLKFCLERFEVGIWSSAKEFNVNKTLDCIIDQGLKSKLLFAWGQDKCTDTGFMSLEGKDKPLFVKELNKLWEDKNAMLPRFRGQFSPSNTLLIDDKPYKNLLNPVHNAIFPDYFKVDDAEDDTLGPNSELRMYLDKLVDADDVRSYVKGNPFGKPAITTTHSHWNYYSKVVRKFQGASSSSSSS